MSGNTTIPRSFDDEIEDLVTFANENPEEFDEDDGVSLSAAKDENEDDSSDSKNAEATHSRLKSFGALDALRVVDLPSDRMREYEAFFYAGTKKKAIAPFLDELGEVAYRVNCFYAFMRRLLQRGREFSRMDDAGVQEIVTEIYENIMATRVKVGSRAETVRRFSGALMHVNAHCVARSEIYKDGVDIRLGSPHPEQTQPPTFLLGNDNAISDYARLADTPYGAKWERHESWLSHVGERVLRAADRINQYLLGTSEISAKARISTLSAKFKFSEIENIFTQETGFALPGTMIEDITYALPSIEQFLRIDAIRFPSTNLVRAVSELGVDNILRDGTLEDSDARLAAVINDREKVVPEYEKLNAPLCFTLRITLESDIAHFISQTPESKPASLVQISNWFASWAQYYFFVAGATSLGRGLRDSTGLNDKNLPRYVLPLSAMSRVSSERRANGLSHESQRGNQDGLYLSPGGAIRYMPSVDVRDSVKSAEKYEQICEELYEYCARHGITVFHFWAANQDGRTPEHAESLKLVTSRVPRDDLIRMQELLAQSLEYSNAILSYDWDYPTLSRASIIPGYTVTARNIGAKRPDDLAVADYLGMNLAKEGATPQQKPFNIAMALTVRDELSVKDVPVAARSYGSSTDISAFSSSNVAAAIASFYIEQSLIPERNFPTLQDLIKQAMQNLGYSSERGGIPAGPKHYDPSHTYSKDINPATGNIVNLYGVQNFPQIAVKLIQNLLRIALENASGNYGTGLYTSLRYELAGDPPRNVASDEMLDALSESPLHFNPETSPMADFARTYNYLGGQVFKLILDKINSISDADLLAHKHTSRVYHPASEDGYSKEVRFNSISQNMVLSVVKPISVLLGKYAPNKETIFASAKAQLESQQRDDSFTADDLKVPGLNSDAPRAVFPHQLDTQSYLRKGTNPPPFAVLGISPGGGKTGIGTMDIACIVKEMQSINVKIIPLVICPDNLIQTWCNDIKYFMGSNWNPFPLSGKIASRWGLERLQELASEAPTNTIFVAGMNFLNSAKQTFMIGSTQVKMSAYFEMVKRLNPNYIIIDESHKLKKNTSQRHNIVKMLTTMSSMRFLRIASGTLMPDRPRDIEAQVALYSPHIFRTGEFSDLTNEEILNKQENGEDIDEDFKALAQSGKIPLWKAGTPERARDKLASYSALIYKKRKEWAWMMPTPIEVFHTVNMVDSAAKGRELQQQELHQALYEHVLHITIEEIEALIKKAKNKKKSEDDDDEKFDEEDESGGEGDGNESDSLEGQIKTHLARIERVMLAPQADEEFETIFGSFGEGYIPNKAKYVANLVAQHFHPPVWKREGTLLAPTRNGGMESRRYREYDLVKYGDDFYMARKIDMSSNVKKELPPEALGVSPDKLPEYWKKEPYGKLIIITRFNATAQAVYDALPTEYQRQTAVFTGDNKNKMEDFERFKSNKDVNILIANEQGMSEGHNLQMASRIIRVESPWGPGELDQTSSRIFRPDPKGATSQADGRGELYRDVVFLDWVITDNTVEVSKQARVISKIFATQRIEESNNPLYADVFKTYHVPNEIEEPLLRLGVEALQNKLGLNDDPFDNMREAYSALNGVIAREFHDMRVNGQAGLIKIEGSENVAGAVIGAQMPFIAHQDIPDPHNWKPKTVHHLIQNDERYKTNPNLLIGMPVVTDLGTGVISSLNWGKGENRSKLSSVKVQLKNVIPGRKPTISFALSVTYVPTNPISTVDRRKYFDVDVKENAAERRAREKEEEALRKQEELERKAEEERKAQEKAEAIRRVRAKEDAAIRRNNEKENKPINQGVVFDPDISTKVKTGVKAVVAGNNRLTVAPAYFHGYLTLEAEPETDDVNLKKLGFRHSGEYAYVACTTRGRLHAVFDYLEDNFELSDATIARLSEVQKAFEKGARGKYVMDLLPHDTLPFFFASQKRIVKNRREVRVFPILMHNHVMLAVHIPTCPAILQHINEAIPGAATKWQKSPGHWHYFANGKTDVRNKIAEIKRNGYSVTNEKEAIKELTEIQFRKPRATKDK